MSHHTNDYYKSVHLTLVLYGFANPKTDFEPLKLLHRFLTKSLMAVYYVTIALLMVQMFVLIWQLNEEYKMLTIMFITNLLTMLKIKVITSRSVSKLYSQIDVSEAKIMKLFDEEKKLYNENIEVFSLIKYLLWIVNYSTFFSEMASYLLRYEHYTKVIKSYNGTLANATLPEIDKPHPYVIYEILGEQFYWLYIAMEVLTAHAALGYLICTDAIYLLFVFYSIGQFKVIQNVIRNCDKAIDGLDATQSVHYWIRWSILEHQNLLRLTKEVDVLFSGIMFIDFLSRSSQLALIILQIFELGFRPEVMFPLVYFCMTTLEIALFQWNADHLTFESIQLSRAIYESKWYTFDEKAKFLLLNMMTRCQYPVFLHIGPFGVMSNEVLVKIMKSIYTCLMFMQQFMKK